MKGIFFNDRDGQTVLSSREKEGLRFDHITSMKELDEAEQYNINQGLVWLSQQKTSEYIHESFYRKLHTNLFGEVWAWAGKYRLTAKNIGIDHWKIPSELRKLNEDTEFWLTNETYEQVEILARFHHRLVFIHPFANGNGRFSRIMTNYLASRRGFSLPNWHKELDPAPRRKAYISALREADNRSYKDLIAYFRP